MWFICLRVSKAPRSMFRIRLEVSIHTSLLGTFEHWESFEFLITERCVCGGLLVLMLWRLLCAYIAYSYFLCKVKQLNASWWRQRDTGYIENRKRHRATRLLRPLLPAIFIQGIQSKRTRNALVKHIIMYKVRTMLAVTVVLLTIITLL